MFYVNSFNHIYFYFNNFNYFINYFIYFKKSNIFFKKINNLETNFNKITMNSYFFNNYLFNKNFYIQQNKLNIKILFFTTNEFNLKNNLKFIDIKKKFFKNLIEKKNILNFLLSYRLKKYKVNRKNFNYYFYYYKKLNSSFNTNILNILLFSKFFFSYSDLIFFLSNNYIFLNRKIFKPYNLNKLYQLYFFKNNIIEISFNKFYTIFLKKNIYFFNLMSNHKNLNYKNSKSLYCNNYLKKINNFNYIFFNKFIFFEIDFKTFTIIFLYYNIINYYTNLNKNYYINHNLIDFYK